MSWGYADTKLKTETVSDDLSKMAFYLHPKP